MISCVRCKRPLPLVDAPEHELSNWVCAACGTAYRAAIDPRSNRQERKQVLLDPRAQAADGLKIRECR